MKRRRGLRPGGMKTDKNILIRGRSARRWLHKKTWNEVRGKLEAEGNKKMFYNLTQAKTKELIE